MELLSCTVALREQPSMWLCSWMMPVKTIVEHVEIVEMLGLEMHFIHVSRFQCFD